MKRISNIICLCLLSSFASTTRANNLRLRHMNAGFTDAAHVAIKQYGETNHLNLERADARAFGFSLERHGGQQRVIVFDTSRAGELAKSSLVCDLLNLFCQAQIGVTTTQYTSLNSTFSMMQLESALETIVSWSVARGVALETLSLFKIWQGRDGIYARIGFEANAIEVGFVCRPGDHSKIGNPDSCLQASAVLPNEP